MWTINEKFVSYINFGTEEDPIWINVTAIESFVKHMEGSMIRLKSGKEVMSQFTPDEIMNALTEKEG